MQGNNAEGVYMMAGICVVDTKSAINTLFDLISHEAKEGNYYNRSFLVWIVKIIY